MDVSINFIKHQQAAPGLNVDQSLSMIFPVQEARRHWDPSLVWAAAGLEE